jgi:hypothetical protein
MSFVMWANIHHITRASRSRIYLSLVIIFLVVKWRFDILTSVCVQSTIFYNVTPCNLDHMTNFIFMSVRSGH